ncbi:MAG: D-glycero-beta-D-manno-heptose 1-phosphate adenylyltransferase [Bacteroidales bacterium]|nr:D-glycero-beta-D-manno-heptose 1-phosphate adenylyltransferase [Candidatus Latescibacterota bacterium]
MSGSEERILKREQLLRFREENGDRRIVFTNGCFDIIHRGHVELLEQARALGDCLVVGMNSDESVKKLKGAPRPLVSADDRAFVLLGLGSVDYVTVFGEDTPLETITALRPDVLVKGSEYGEGEIVGEDFVTQAGGKVERIRMVAGYSTTSLIEKMKQERK